MKRRNGMHQGVRANPASVERYASGVSALGSSGQQLLDDFAMNVCQPKITALKAVDQFGVIESQQVQDSGVEVVDVDAVFGCIEAELVGFTDGDARFRAASGQ